MSFAFAIAVIVVGVSLHFLAKLMRSTGRTPISRHDTVYAGLPPGAVPSTPDAPTRPATAEDAGAVVAVRFDPPQGVRPEEVGLLTSAQVESSDVAAAVVALAVDGFIHLERVAPQGRKLWGPAKPEWLVTVNRLAPPEEIGAFRAGLLAALTHYGRPATLTQLKPHLGSVIGQLRTQLRDEPHHRFWYPNLGRVFSLHGNRQRTALGAALRYQSAGFRMFLETADGNRLRFEEGAGIFSRFLPWAVAYGVTQQWVKAFQEAAAMADPSMAGAWASDLAWYGAFGDFGDLSFDGLGDAMTDFGDAIGDLADGIGDLASDLSSDVGDAGGGDGGDGGGDGGGGGD